MPKLIWRLMTIGPRTLYRLGLGWIIGNRVLLLTTIGRVSGLPRTTPLQYEYIDGEYVIGSARGLQADWVKNILKEPKVSVQIGRERIDALGRVISNPKKVADFLELRYVNHPLFVKIIFRLQGYRGDINRGTLVRYAKERAMVILHPHAE